MGDIAQAYVQVIPSAKGMKGKLTEALGGESKSAGLSAGASFGSNLVSTFKKILVAAGIGETIKKSITEGAALQQSLGGIETMFKENADRVIANADQAYRTCGMSANGYMEQVTGFSASLLQSLEGDTTKATNIADMAMRDMADNSNKYGTDIERIFDAYQGFAKQNYTMLDNLKLGYGGTKSEMERLLSDAQKLTGVKYDIGNLSDVYNAIHAIQENLGVTGTTAEEAASTISGSAASMKAAFSNVLGNLALGRDIGPSLEALGETVFTFFGNNLIPAVGNILKNLPTVINSAFSMAIRGLNLVKGNAKQILKSGAELVVQIGQAIITNIPALAEAGLALITEIGRALVETDWTEFAASAINGLRANLDTAAGEILGTDGSIVDSVLNAITENLPGILERGVEIVTNVANGILEGLPQIISTAGDLVNRFVEFLIQNAPAILAAGAQLLLNLAQGLISNLPAIISSAASIVGQLLSTLASYLPDLLAQGISLIANLIAGLISMIPDIISAAGDIINNIKEQFGNIDWAEIGKNIIQGIANGIKNGVSTIIDAAKEAAQKAFEAAKKKLDINSPSRLFRKEIGYNISAGMALGISDGIPLVEYAANSLSRSSTSAFSGKLAASSGKVSSAAGQSNGKAFGKLEINQYINSKAQTAADLMIECRYNAELAVMLGV